MPAMSAASVGRGRSHDRKEDVTSGGIAWRATFLGRGLVWVHCASGGGRGGWHWSGRVIPKVNHCVYLKKGRGGYK